jgi:SHAQKYF class myb-like DNA-binding protein
MKTAILTSYHSDCDDIAAEAMALGLPPPMVCIPARGPSTRESNKRGTSPFEDVSTPTTSVADHRPSEEKVGRWTEEEHGTFLQGLKLHGKQWKTIATMIGTRTVVQVRTHAQKYFQKLERKNKDAMAASIAEKPKTSKRKSLPSAMPSRKKPRFPGKKSSYTRSQSLTLSAAVLGGPPPSM